MEVTNVQSCRALAFQLANGSGLKSAPLPTQTALAQSCTDDITQEGCPEGLIKTWGYLRGEQRWKIYFYEYECFAFLYACASLKCAVPSEASRGH